MGEETYWLGLMSGTSVDAIDAVAIHCEPGHPPRLAHAVSHAWPVELQSRLRTLPTQPPPAWPEWLQLDVAVAVEHANAIETLRQQLPVKATIGAVGFHGQTIFHAPADGNTLQLGSPAHLAQRCRLPVIGDMRRADMAWGGQGAPLAPLFHHALFASLAPSVVVLNLGGIANITHLRDATLCAGFDTGPANALMDVWCQQHFQCDYDAGGALARQGRVLPELLARLLDEPYFVQPAPKSTGREYFHSGWLAERCRADEAPIDILRTLLALTATTVAESIRPLQPDSVVVVGGGRHNTLLCDDIAIRIGHHSLTPSDELGWPSHTIEAGLMAWLAAQHCAQHRSDTPRVTGASQAPILGAHYPAG
ncbi:MAG: anhydro-N-acetylmuramic acid kinase [Oceanococcaceae bacterium]